MYESFGNLTFSEGTPADSNSFRYTGREFDEETGLYYYRARYYDPEVGRFMNEDPIGFSGGINFYSYVGNNPINFIDPLGLCEENPTDKIKTVRKMLTKLRKLLGDDDRCRDFLKGSGNIDPRALMQSFIQGENTITVEDFGRIDLWAETIPSSGERPKIEIKINKSGGFFNKQTPDGCHMYILPGTATVGGTPSAQGQILLHEIGHLTGVLRPDLNVPDEMVSNVLNQIQIRTECAQTLSSFDPRFR